MGGAGEVDGEEKEEEVALAPSGAGAAASCDASSKVSRGVVPGGEGDLELR